MPKKILKLPTKPTPNSPKTEALKLVSQSTLTRNRRGALGAKSCSRPAAVPERPGCVRATVCLQEQRVQRKLELKREVETQQRVFRSQREAKGAKYVTREMSK